MINSRKVIGIVLSGGKSSRMGTEKGLVSYKGKALIEYSIEVLRSVCDELVISSNNECYSYLGIPIVNDKIQNCGPMGGIYSCMKAIPSDIYLVISCDVPHVSSQLFADLLDHIGEANSICPIDEFGRKQPLIAAYSSACFSIIECELLSGNFKMMNLLNKLHAKMFTISSYLDYYSSKLLFNVNSINDIK